MEARLVLRVVAVEEERGLVGGAEERLGDQRPTEAVDDRAGLQGAAADLQVVVDGLGGEVEELQVDSWGGRNGSFTDFRAGQHLRIGIGLVLTARRSEDVLLTLA